METAKSIRRATRSTELARRYSELLEKCREERTFDLSLFPNLHDGVRTWFGLIFADFSRIPVTRTRFSQNPVTQHLKTHLEIYQSDVRRGFERLLRNTTAYSLCEVTPEWIHDPAVFFVCRALTCRDVHPLPWRAMHAHWREAHPHTSIWKRSVLDYHDASLRFRYWEEGNTLARQVISRLRTSGFGPHSLDIEGLDKLVQCGRLYCACGDPSLPLPSDLTWAELVSAHKSYSLKF